MTEVLSREQMITLINEGFDIQEHKFSHVHIKNEHTKLDKWIIMNSDVNRSDKINNKTESGQGYSFYYYDEVIDVIPTLSMTEVFDNIACNPKAKDVNFKLMNKEWALYDGIVIKDKKPHIKEVVFSALLYLLKKS